ncbi:hypothetical protein BST61_g10533 [Cercospora zeina]
MFSFPKPSRASSPRQSSPKQSVQTDTEWIMVDDDDTSSTQQIGSRSDKGIEQPEYHRRSAGSKQTSAAAKPPPSTIPSTQSQTKQPKSSPGPCQKQPELDTLLSTLSTQRSELSCMQTSLLEAQAQIQEERDLFRAQYYALRIQQEERETQLAKDKKQEWKDDLETLRLEMAVRATGEEERSENLMKQVEGLVRKVESMERPITRDQRGEERSEAVEILGRQIEQLAMGMQQLTETVSKMQTMQVERSQAAESDQKDLQARFANLEKGIEIVRQEKRLTAPNQQQPTIDALAQPSSSNSPSSQQHSLPLVSDRESYLGNKRLPKVKGTPSSTSSLSTSSPNATSRRRPHRTSHPDHIFNANIRPRSSRLERELEDRS